MVGGISNPFSLWKDFGYLQTFKRIIVCCSNLNYEIWFCSRWLQIFDHHSTYEGKAVTICCYVLNNFYFRKCASFKMLLKCHYFYYIYYMNCDISCLSELLQSSRTAIVMSLKKAPVGSIGLGRMKIWTHNHCLPSRWSDPISCWSRMDVATENVIGGNVGFLLSACHAGILSWTAWENQHQSC